MVEQGSTRHDRVISSVSLYLADGVEYPDLAGDADLYGVGNGADNHITGNVGDNVLVGGDGWDTLDGGNGGDALYGGDGNDALIGGADFVFDMLVGGDGDDVLNGASGLGDQDHLYGGAGDDTFYVDTPHDLVFELAGEGVDLVIANITGTGYYLHAEVENLHLHGATPFGVGNDLANTIWGSAQANWLLGGGGDDVLDGGAGNDVLFGEAGADIFVFWRGSGGDAIADFTPGTDRIDLSAFGFTGIAQVKAAMRENGPDSVIDLSSGDFVVLNGVLKDALDADDFILAGVSAAHDVAEL